MKGPWIKFFPSDFLNGVADMDDGQRGAYITVLCLIYDRGGAIPDDHAWLARRCGISRRKWTATRQQLLDMGKIQLTDAGELTNRRALKDLQERGQVSETRRTAADARWNAKQAELPMETGENGHSRNAYASTPEKTAAEQQNGRKLSEFSPKNPDLACTFSARENGLKNEESAENGHSGDANAYAYAFPLARARVPEARDIDNNNDQFKDATRVRAREGPAVAAGEDLHSLTMACCDAAGLSARIASRPALLAQSMDIVKGWRAAGVDIRGTALPIIERKLETMAEESANSLAYFSAAIDTGHSKAKRKRAAAPPPVLEPPQFEFTDEDARMVPFREALAKTVGANRYAQWCRAVLFQLADFQTDGDSALLLVKGRKSGLWNASRVWAAHHAAILTTAKAVLGVQRAWER